MQSSAGGTTGRAPIEAATSAIPRLPFEELPEAVADLLRSRVERLGYLGEFFQATAHQPDLLASFHGFTETGKDALGHRLTEVVALTVAKAAGNAYELHQHERLSVRSGFGIEWVEAVERLQPEDLQVPVERDVQQLVLGLLDDHGRGANHLLEAVAREHGAELAVAVLFVTGRYVVHGTVVNALGLEPPVPSIFADGFVGD